MTGSVTALREDRAGAEELLRALRAGVRGEVLDPASDGYDAARRVYNARADRRPAVIVRCAGVGDVLAALRLARDRPWPLAVRGGGHSAAGFGVCDGGLVLDLSRLKGVRVDPGRRTARAEAGVAWGELDHETQAFGLATTGARISTTGIAGVTLGGGYGWLMRQCGLAVDNLLSVDLVTADGRFLTASAAENAELFWGVRGGGGNFGVVTSLEYRLHAIGPTVTGGMAFYPSERGPQVLRTYRELIASAPDELSALCNFLQLPPAPFVPEGLRGTPVVAVAVCHTGPAEQARRDLRVLGRLGPPLLERIRPMPYVKLQRLYDAAGAFGYHVHGRSGHLPKLSDAVLDLVAARGPCVTSPLSIVMISALGGAVARVGEHDTAFSHRRTAFDCAITSVWADPAESVRHVAWTEDFWAALRPHTAGAYVNELGDEGEQRVREAYNPATYQRLLALKKIFDPTNRFRLNHNVRPDA
jgi:FAD/FMN-containing dehydrogenase